MSPMCAPAKLRIKLEGLSDICRGKSMAIKARVVQMKMDLDDQRKAARLLGGAIGKEITARRREIDELKERGATLVRNASNQHHSMLFKHLGQVEARSQCGGAKEWDVSRPFRDLFTPKSNCPSIAEN